MATYGYRCCQPSHEVLHFDAVHPVGTAPTTTACPRCGGDAVRVFSPPMIARAHAGARALLDRAERSRSEPEVVSALPARTDRPWPQQAVKPAWSNLPRP